MSITRREISLAVLLTRDVFDQLQSSVGEFDPKARGIKPEAVGLPSRAIHGEDSAAAGESLRALDETPVGVGENDFAFGGDAPCEPSEYRVDGRFAQVLRHALPDDQRFLFSLESSPFKGGRESLPLQVDRDEFEIGWLFAEDPLECFAFAALGGRVIDLKEEGTLGATDPQSTRIVARAQDHDLPNTLTQGRIERVVNVSRASHGDAAHTR